MVTIEIPTNPNCEAVELRVFHDLEPGRPVHQIRLEQEPGRSEWYDVVGWSLQNAPVPAMAQKVDDSGEGVAFLVHGGEAGLRLRPAGLAEPWQLAKPAQWGLPFIITADAGDLRFAAS